MLFPIRADNLLNSYLHKIINDSISGEVDTGQTIFYLVSIDLQNCQSVLAGVYSPLHLTNISICFQDCTADRCVLPYTCLP